MRRNLVVIALLILIGVGYFAYHSNLGDNKAILKTEKKEKINTIKVTQRIIESKKIKTDLGESAVKPGTNALDLLASAAKIAKKGEGANSFITAINGREAKDAAREFWAFYVNGKQAEVGAGSYILKDGDVVEWKLENY